VPPSGRETSGTADLLIRRRIRGGRTFYLNLSPLAYAYFPFRTGTTGQSWREVVGQVLPGVGLRPRVEIYGPDGKEPWIESLLWRNGDRYCLAVLKNLPESADAPESLSMIDQDPKEITIQLSFRVRNLRNVRTGKSFADNTSFKDTFKPWEANLYEFTIAK
jgi:hypothetical protein